MANALIAYGNLTDAATLSGGSWLSTLPLNNLKQRVMGKVARSTNLNLTSTKFTVDVGVDKTVRLICLSGHNLSLAAKYRITYGAITTGWLDVWPVVYDSTQLSWQSVNWWSGKYTAAEIQGFTWNIIHIFDSSIKNQVWTIEIDDQQNTAGYIQAGRLFIGDGWQPSVNMSYGAGIGWEVATGVQEALSGTEYFDPKTPYRVVKMSTDWMSEVEAMGNAFDIQRRSGISNEVVFVWDTADTAQAVRRRYLGRLRQLSPIENPYLAIHRTAWEIKEII